MAGELAIVSRHVSTMEAMLPPGVAAPEDFAAREAQLLERTSQLLGWGKIFKHPLRSRLEVHSAIVTGAFPYASLLLFISNLTTLTEGDVVNVLGISGRTLRRHREASKESMPADLASRAWLFAESLAKAIEVFGSPEQAEEWMNRPATGLNGQRPIEMLHTIQGTELVNDFLTRLEYNVYS